MIWRKLKIILKILGMLNNKKYTIYLCADSNKFFIDFDF